MKLFQLMQQIYKTLGVVSPSQHNENRRINSKILIILLPMVLFSVSSVIFLFFKAKTAQEIADSSFWTTAAYISIFTFLRTVFKMPMTFDLVWKFEEVIRKSKMKIQSSKFLSNLSLNLFLPFSFTERNDPIKMAKYSKMNARIEYFTEWYQLIFIKYFIVISVLPYSFMTYVLYMFDWGDDPYILPFPTA